MVRIVNNYSIGGQKFLEKRHLLSNESTAKVDRAFSVALAGIIVNSVEPDAVSQIYLHFLGGWPHS